MRIALNPKHNDWYEELCALACIGELSSSEFEELQAHLADCASCRELHADFRRISADDLGRAAVARNQERTVAEDSERLDEHALLCSLLDRAGRQRPGERFPTEEALPHDTAVRARPQLRPLLDWLRRPALSYGTVGLLLCATVGIGAYRLREAQLSPALGKLQSEVDQWKGQARAAAAEKERASLLLAHTQAERDTLRKSLEEAETGYGQQQRVQKSLETELAAERALLKQQGEELEGATATASEKRAEVAALEARVRSAADRSEEQRRLAENLQAKLDHIQQAAVAPEAQGFGDLEARQLFGARDLHIVDVYDVDAKGATRRTYGRVYYVEKKLLMLYAFDLENKKRNRAPASFQAWGYRQPNESKPESLGLFSMDDASVNRWVLRVNNPRVLERIDAVFVTAEVPNGSPAPTGRRVLYANLAGPANHP